VPTFVQDIEAPESPAVVEQQPEQHDATGLAEREFEEIYRQLVPQIFRYLARRVGTGSAEDLTAQTFAEAWASRARFDARLGTPSSWIYGIALHQVGRHRRREMSQLRLLGRARAERSESFDEAGAVHRIAVQQNMSWITEELAQLSELDRDILTLAGWAGLSYEDIGRAVGVPVGTVKSRLSRTRARLARRLAAVVDPA
jgi:RNA polymerase sigma factor (sigma-70 family)